MGHTILEQLPKKRKFWNTVREHREADKKAMFGKIQTSLIFIQFDKYQAFFFFF